MSNDHMTYLYNECYSFSYLNGFRRTRKLYEKNYSETYKINIITFN